jgi:hypothetical protein
MSIDQALLTQWIKSKLANPKTASESNLLLELADDFNLFDVDEFLIESK